MKKIYLALAFLITGFLMASDAYGEDEVYYCAEIDDNGFFYDKKLDSYKRQGFISDKFKIKLDKASNSIEKVGDDGFRYKYTCITPAYDRPEILICTSASLSQFNFNTNNGRFVLSLGFGYIVSDGDSISLSFGKCDKF